MTQLQFAPSCFNRDFGYMSLYVTEHVRRCQASGWNVNCRANHAWFFVHDLCDWSTRPSDVDDTMQFIHPFIHSMQTHVHLQAC